MGYEMMLAQMEKTYAAHTLELEDTEINNHTYKDEQQLLELVRRGDTAGVRVAADTMFRRIRTSSDIPIRKTKNTWRSLRWR